MGERKIVNSSNIVKSAVTVLYKYIDQAYNQI